jgi:hypothetical protein
MLTQRLFLASSRELQEDRQEFETFINRKNKDWVKRGVFIELVVWEDFLDAVSRTRLQDEYNRAIRGCDLFVMLFWTKVGAYTQEEFATAFGQFQVTNRPFIFTYFKDAPLSTGSAYQQDLMSLRAFQNKLDQLGHFYTRYQNLDALKLHFNGQLDKLAAGGFITFAPDQDAATAPGATVDQATLNGSGAIAQGGGTAVGARGVSIGGNNTGRIITGTEVHTGGGAYIHGHVDTGGGDFIGRDQCVQGVPAADLEPLFAPLLAAIARQVPASAQPAALQQAQALKAEVAKGSDADDGRLGRLLDGLLGLVPGAVGAVVSLFATPILQGIGGPVTRFVLDRLKAD